MFNSSVLSFLFTLNFELKILIKIMTSTKTKQLFGNGSNKLNIFLSHSIDLKKSMLLLQFYALSFPLHSSFLIHFQLKFLKWAKNRNGSYATPFIIQAI